MVLRVRRVLGLISLVAGVGVSSTPRVLRPLFVGNIGGCPWNLVLFLSLTGEFQGLKNILVRGLPSKVALVSQMTSPRDLYAM